MNMKRLLLSAILAALSTAAFADYDLKDLKDTDYIIHVQIRLDNVTRHAIWSNSYFNDKASCTAFMDDDNARWQVALADVLRYVQAAGGVAVFDCVTAPEGRKFIHDKDTL